MCGFHTYLENQFKKREQHVIAKNVGGFVKKTLIDLNTPAFHPLDCWSFPKFSSFHFWILIVNPGDRERLQIPFLEKQNLLLLTTTSYYSHLIMGFSQ